MFKKFHELSMYNRQPLEHVDECGCFYCLEIFNPKQITEWTDMGQTALCPYCDIDSVIYTTQMGTVAPHLLKAMQRVYFNSV